MAKKGLGKGLDALFHEEGTADGLQELKITEVMPNKDQPRKSFDEEKLKSLADSVKEHGLIQPIVVRKSAEGYVIIAGERRWRAAKLAGLKKIPVLIKDYDDLTMKEIALIENLQREDLNPIEEALGYRSLMDEYNLTQEEISMRLGKSRSAIANSVRLLTLDDYTRAKLISGEITEGHARCALSVPNGVVREFFVNRIIADGLNVRQAELLAKDLAKITEADGGILFAHWGCKNTLGASSLLKSSLEDAGLPTMILDGDGCNPANTSDGQVSTRLQAFVEMLQEGKEEKRA